MKNTLVLLILTAGISTLAAQTEDRQRPQRPDPKEIFKTADIDKDGFLDLKELTTFRDTMAQGRGGNRGGPNAGNDASPPREGANGGPGGQGRGQAVTPEEMMANMDKNKDGKIAPDEFTMGNRRGPGAEGQPGGKGARAKKPE
jgi:Ca2+-binding EF-hand superfamily protein